MRFWRKLPLSAWLVLMALIGLALIVGPALPDLVRGKVTVASVALERAPEVGIALLIAALLAFTVDRSLKSNLMQDVHRAAVGHILPEEFRQEIWRTIGFKFICERHYMRVIIEPIDDEAVRVTCELERRLRNITAFPEETRGFCSVDEWGFAQERSRIIDCRAQVEGKEAIVAPEPERAASKVTARTEDVLVYPDQYVHLRSKWIEIKRRNDELSLVLLSPTKNPEMDVSLPAGLQCSASFGLPGERIEKSEYSHRYLMTGTYFPGQRMSVRWWPQVTEVEGGSA
ncbi:MAG TPA: hypothetical protein VGU20_16865 [Stellaceae bacterium]|nr:hypothetical protein [Stellaceae bacterium]